MASKSYVLSVIEVRYVKLWLFVQWCQYQSFISLAWHFKDLLLQKTYWRNSETIILQYMHSMWYVCKYEAM